MRLINFRGFRGSYQKGPLLFREIWVSETKKIEITGIAFEIIDIVSHLGEIIFHFCDNNSYSNMHSNE